MGIPESEPESKRPMVVPEAYEFKHMLTGKTLKTGCSCGAYPKGLRQNKLNRFDNLFCTQSDFLTKT